VVTPTPVHAHVSDEIPGRFSEAALPMHVTHSVSLSITSHHHPSQLNELEQEGGGVWGGDYPLGDRDYRQHGRTTEVESSGRQTPFEKNTKSYLNGLKRRQALLARSKTVRDMEGSREQVGECGSAVERWTKRECAAILLAQHCCFVRSRPMPCPPIPYLSPFSLKSPTVNGYFVEVFCKIRHAISFGHHVWQI